MSDPHAKGNSEAESPAVKDKAPRRPVPLSDLRNLNLDPTDSQGGDPESWDEYSTGGSDLDRYLKDRPPHHGD